MNQFRKIVLAWTLFAALITAATSAPAAVATKTAAEAEALVPQAAPTLFNIGPLPVTNSMVCTWIVAALIVLIVRLTTWKMKEVPAQRAERDGSAD